MTKLSIRMEPLLEEGSVLSDQIFTSVLDKSFAFFYEKLMPFGVKTSIRVHYNAWDGVCCN